MIKTLNKPEIEGNFLNLIKGIYEKPTANVILHGEKLKIKFSSKIRNKTKKLAPQLPFNTVREILGKKEKRQRKK